MKNLAIFGLAAVGASFAAGSLWNMDVDAYQVQTPEAVACDKEDPAYDDYGAHCYQSTGGWWFVYDGGTDKGQSVSFEPIGENDDGTPKLITTDEEDGSILPNGNLIENQGLMVKMTTAGGASASPALAGIGFNWTKAETPIDISAKPGYCIVYSWDNEEPLQLELGWDDRPQDEGGLGYDSWYAKMPGTAGSFSKLDFAFANGFKQDKWDKPLHTIDEALQGSKSMKIRLKNTGAAVISGTLIIQEFGWMGECGAGGTPAPSAIGAKAVAASLKAQLSGRTLSFGKVVKAEILNLQGQVVASATSSSMDLSKLQAGVYMVRSEGLSQKILLK